MNIGDKVTHYVTGEEFTIWDMNIRNVWLRKSNGHIDCTDRQFVYQCWYEAEKKRADAAEKVVKDTKTVLTMCVTGGYAVEGLEDKARFADSILSFVKELERGAK